MTARRRWTPTPGSPLTARQLDYLHRTAEGEPWSKIGTELGLTLGGVGTLSKQVLLKLGARSAAHAVHLAHQAGLLGRPPRLRVPKPPPKPGAGPDDARRIAARLEAAYTRPTKEQHR